MKKVQDIKDFKGKKFLLRVDFNVPMKNGEITDTERIEASIETINYLTDRGAGVVICAHLGRPEGRADAKYSLRKVAEKLENLNKKSVQFISESVGETKDLAVKNLQGGEIVMLENLRFYPEEEANDKEFSKRLAKGFDYYVNDAFSNSHRAHASMMGVTDFLPSFAGFSLQREVENLSRLFNNPKRPFVVISGGVKISDKIGFLENLIKLSDVILVGGGMANTFLCADGLEIGCSVSEEDYLEKAREIGKEAANAGVALVLPEDVVVTKVLKEHPLSEEKDIEDVDTDDIIADIGTATIGNYIDSISSAGTIFWNGPLGITEYPEFSEGTLEIAKAVAASKAFSVIGGGETIASIPDEVKGNFDFVSLSGGATMEYLEGKSLPALQPLQ